MSQPDLGSRAGRWSVAPPGRGAIPRRTALRSAVGAAGVAAAGAVLAACSGAKQAAAPTAAAKVIFTMVWRPWYNFNNATSKTGKALLLQGIEPWLAQNPGVNVDISFLGYQGTTVTALLAGNGPDIFADWVLPLFLSGNLVQDLTNFVKQDNVDLTIFPKLEMEFFQQEGGLWALPSYLHLQCPAVNLGMLDNLGLSYPQSGWTYTDWTQLFQQTTNKSTTASQKRIGTQFYWSGYDYSGSNPHAYYLKGFGGEYVDPSDPTKCYLTNPASLKCMQWIYGLIQQGVANTGGSNFVSGQIAVSNADTAGGLIGAAESWRALKWQIYDEPIYPAGPVAYAASDFYAISAATARPDIAWDFMKYLCVGQDWQRWMMKLAMNGPNQKSLYPEWVTTLKAIAPPLANIDLDVFNRQMQNDEPYFGLTFRYQETQAAGAINAQTAPALTQKVDLPTALTQATNQVDAIELAGEALVASAATTAKLFPTNGKAIASVVAGI